MAAAPTLREDAAVMGLVGIAHFTSHFFQLMLPVLFPEFVRAFGVSYSQLGLLVTMIFIISATGQALAGFVVDRVGARAVLFAAMGCFVLAALAAATATGYGGLVLAGVLVGVGNSPFHPADLTILNRRVSTRRLGHAFSVHGLSGSLGWACAPLFVIAGASLAGGWRQACLAIAVLALGVLALLFVKRSHLGDRPGLGVAVPSKAIRPSNPSEHALAFVRLPAVWLCFMFFFWSTASLAAIQGFAPVAMGALYGLPLATTALVVTGYMLCHGAGMVAGGFLVSARARLESTIGLAMSASALALLVVASGWLAPIPALLLAAAAGLGTGLAGPSRDMLIRQVAPAGATGRVYGTIYSGLDVGLASAAPAFGWLLDHGRPGTVMALSAVALLLGVASAAWVGLSQRRTVSSSTV